MIAPLGCQKLSPAPPFLNCPLDVPLPFGGVGGARWAETQLGAAPSVGQGIRSKRPKQSRKKFGEFGF